MIDHELYASLVKDKGPEGLEKLRRQLLIEKLSGLLHTLLCAHDHTKDCDYYMEETMAKQSRAREEWDLTTKKLLEKAEATSEQLEEIVRKLPVFISQCCTNVAFLKFLHCLIPSLIVSLNARPGQLPSFVSDLSGSGESPLG